MPIKINGATSGSTTITAPATGGDESIELSTALAAKLDLAGGKILQVIFAEASAQVTVSTTTYTDTGLSATITPSSASSKVLILASQAAGIAKDTASEVNLDYRLMRDATAIFTSEDYGLSAKNVLQLISVIPITYLDSPNTTSAVTYKVQGRPDTTLNSQTARFQTSSRPRSHIILMEVSA